MSDLPNRIRELRKARGWSLDTMAPLVGCSKVQLADLELGKRRLSTYWMERVARALGVPIPDLLNDDQNPFRLNEREMEIIERYRAGDDDQRKTFERMGEVIIPYTAPPSEKDRAA